MSSLTLGAAALSFRLLAAVALGYTMITTTCVVLIVLFRFSAAHVALISQNLTATCRTLFFRFVHKFEFN